MKKIKKIIFTTIAMSGGGTERVISILANYYVEQGIDVFIYMIAGNQVEYELDSRIHLEYISGVTGGSLTGRLNRIGHLRKQIKKETGAVVIAMGTVTAMFTLAATIGMKCPVVISERNDPNRLNHKPITKAARWLRNILYIRATKIIMQTEDAKRCFPKKIQNKSTVILNPVSDDLPQVDLNCQREKTVITAGRLTEQKNHRLLIVAFQEFLKIHSDYVLKIFGTGEMKEELQKIIIDKELQGKVILEGFCSNLYNELQSGGIYISSSNWEGISNSLVEAMVMGIPVVATDCPMGGSRMLIQNGVNGILIPMEDKEQLVRALCELVEDEVKRKSFSENAVQIRKYLSVEKIAEKWLRCFE